jgi:hypothetical protein
MPLKQSFSRCSHAQRLMRSPIVVKADPVADHTADALQSLQAMSVHALVFERSYHAFHQAILLGRGGVMNSWRRPQRRDLLVEFRSS